MFSILYSESPTVDEGHYMRKKLYGWTIDDPILCFTLEEEKYINDVLVYKFKSIGSTTKYYSDADIKQHLFKLQDGFDPYGVKLDMDTCVVDHIIPLPEKYHKNYSLLNSEHNLQLLDPDVAKLFKDEYFSYNYFGKLYNKRSRHEYIHDYVIKKISNDLYRVTTRFIFKSIKFISLNELVFREW